MRRRKFSHVFVYLAFLIFFFIEKISGDSILLTQKERCPKRYPNLFLRDSFCRGLSQWRFRWGYFKSLFFEGRFCQGLSHNHRVEFFEPIFFLKFVTFLPLTFAKTFFRPWELLPLIYIYIYNRNLWNSYNFSRHHYFLFLFILDSSYFRFYILYIYYFSSKCNYLISVTII